MVAGRFWKWILFLQQKQNMEILVKIFTFILEFVDF